MMPGILPATQLSFVWAQASDHQHDDGFSKETVDESVEPLEPLDDCNSGG